MSLALVLLGKQISRKILKDKINKWKWEGTVEDILDYWFETESRVDERILKVVDDLRQKGIKCYVATNQEKYRTEYFKKKMHFEEIFDGIFSSAYIGYRKPEPKFFEYVLEELKVKPEEILYWDDSEGHVESARELGIQAHLYKDFEEFYEQIFHLLGVWKIHC